jgi:hypothetical protein
LKEALTNRASLYLVLQLNGKQFSRSVCLDTPQFRH